MKTYIELFPEKEPFSSLVQLSVSRADVDPQGSTSCAILRTSAGKLQNMVPDDHLVEGMHQQKEISSANRNQAISGKGLMSRP